MFWLCLPRVFSVRLHYPIMKIEKLILLKINGVDHWKLIYLLVYLILEVSIYGKRHGEM